MSQGIGIKVCSAVRCVLRDLIAKVTVAVFFFFFFHLNGTLSGCALLSWSSRPQACFSQTDVMSLCGVV